MSQLNCPPNLKMVTTTGVWRLDSDAVDASQMMSAIEFVGTAGGVFVLYRGRYISVKHVMTTKRRCEDRLQRATSTHDKWDYRALCRDAGMDMADFALWLSHPGSLESAWALFDAGATLRREGGLEAMVGGFRFCVYSYIFDDEEALPAGSFAQQLAEQREVLVSRFHRFLRLERAKSRFKRGELVDAFAVGLAARVTWAWWVIEDTVQQGLRSSLGVQLFEDAVALAGHLASMSHLSEVPPLIADVPSLVLEWSKAPRNPAQTCDVPSPCLRYAQWGQVIGESANQSPVSSDKVRAFSNEELIDLMGFPTLTKVTRESPPCVGYSVFPMKAKVQA
jgi:hypothetical protein